MYLSGHRSARAAFSLLLRRTNPIHGRKFQPLTFSLVASQAQVPVCPKVYARLFNCYVILLTRRARPPECASGSRPPSHTARGSRGCTMPVHVTMIRGSATTKHRRSRLVGVNTAFFAAIVVLASWPAVAADQVHDEIQVYNAEIAGVGQWTFQQHLNYAAIGQAQPEVPNGFASNHSLQGTPEFAYGIADWWEAGFYMPFAASDRQFLSDGAKIRSLFVVPDAAKRNFFYGVNFELSYEMPRFSPKPWILEIRPIIGVRNGEWEFIVNPIVDLSFGSGGEADFAPAVRLARNLGEDRFIGLEYYSDFGKIGDFLPLEQQSQQLFAVTDFKVRTVDVELGAGYGLTSGSDRFVVKAILGYAFPVPGKSSDGSSTSNTPLAMGTPARALQAAPWTR
jgi:hypothetical protein